MKCFNCGKESAYPLCENCRTEEILNRVTDSILKYSVMNPDKCGNDIVVEYMKAFSENIGAGKMIIDDIIALFSDSDTEYARCRYGMFKSAKDCENIALVYLSEHTDWDARRQRIVYELLQYYDKCNEFRKPEAWCRKIREETALCADLYFLAAKYYSYVAEYDESEEMLDRCASSVNGGDCLVYSPDYALDQCDNLRHLIRDRYRMGKPYWPKYPDRRLKLDEIYKEKGISGGRIENAPKKVNESDFLPIHEYRGDPLKDYCAFCCEGVKTASSPVSSVWQIAAVRVRNGRVEDCFESFVFPWGLGKEWKTVLEKNEWLDVSLVENAERVDLVMKKFFAFVGNDVLVNTEAMSKQGKLLIRAARYNGMNEIKNAFFDLSDYADEVLKDFALKREAILEKFGIIEGKDALEKAEATKKIYDALVKKDKCRQ